MSDQFDYKFWGAIAIATLIRVTTTPDRSWTKSTIVVVSSVFCAWLFTDPLMAFMSWNPVQYRDAVAGLLAILGHGIVRWLLTTSPEKLLDLWRGSK